MDPAAAVPPPHEPSWLDYLPLVLRQPETVFLMLVAFALYGYIKTFPKSDKYPFIPQALTMAVALMLAAGLKIGGSYVYATGTGIICAWGSTSFYDLFFFWLTEKLRAYFGRPTPEKPTNQNPPTP